MKIKNKKGFTLIELIVTIAIISLLVLLAAPRLLGYTDKAVVAELTNNARAIQDASERYHLDEDDWPRLTDKPYSSEEIETFAEKVYGITGEEANLDPNGNYYDIDFDKLESYVSVPGDKANYILQNPVGKVYALKGLTESRFESVPDGSNEVDGSDEIEQEYPAATSQIHFDYIINGGNATITKYKGRDKNVVIPEYIIVSGIKYPVTIIDDFAFYAGTISSWNPTGVKLESVQLPDSIETIGRRSFQDNSLKNVEFGSGIKTISSGAFSENKLTRVSLPEGLKVISNISFMNNELEEVSIPSSVVTIEYMAFYRNNIKNVSIPYNVKSIGSNAFRYNDLYYVNFPNSLNKIERSAFRDNNLSSVQIPKGLSYIATGEDRTFDTSVIIRTR